jgi:hypothetical protein
MSRMQCYEWFKRFKETRMSVSEDPSPGQHFTSTMTTLRGFILLFMEIIV